MGAWCTNPFGTKVQSAHSPAARRNHGSRSTSPRDPRGWRERQRWRWEEAAGANLRGSRTDPHGMRDQPRDATAATVDLAVLAEVLSDKSAVVDEGPQGNNRRHSQSLDPYRIEVRASQEQGAVEASVAITRAFLFAPDARFCIPRCHLRESFRRSQTQRVSSWCPLCCCFWRNMICYDNFW